MTFFMICSPWIFIMTCHRPVNMENSISGKNREKAAPVEEVKFTKEVYSNWTDVGQKVKRSRELFPGEYFSVWRFQFANSGVYLQWHTDNGPHILFLREAFHLVVNFQSGAERIMNMPPRFFRGGMFRSFLFSLSFGPGSTSL